MDFQRKIHDETLQTLERRSRIDIAKLSFVTGLFSVGVIGEIPFGANNNSIALFGTLYLAPFVALAFDCFTWRETWSLRRMGLFLRKRFYEGDTEFETFLEQYKLRNPFYLAGSAGLTLVIIAVSAWLLYYHKDTSKTSSWCDRDRAWLIVSIAFFGIVHIGGGAYMRHTFYNRK